MLVKASPEIKIKFDNEQEEVYSVEKIPEETALVVQDRMKEVLKNVQLAKLARDLDRCANWIYIAYLGTAGYSTIQSQLLILHDDFGKTCAETDVELTNFKDQSKKVIQQLKLGSTCFMIKNVPIACSMLSKCAVIADDLSKRASSLATSYEKLQLRGRDILTAVLQQKDISEEDKAKIIKLREDLQHQEEEKEERKAVLAQQTKTIEQQYNVTKEEAASASNKAFGMAIASTIFSGVSAGIGAAVKANPVNSLTQVLAQKLGEGGTAPAIDSSSADVLKQAHEKEREIKTLETKVEEKQVDLTKAEEEVQKEEVFLERAKEELKKLKADPSGVAEQLISTAEDKVQVLVEKVAGIKIKKGQVLETFNKAKQELQGIMTDYKKLQATLESLSQSTSKMSDNYQQLADSLRKEKMKYFEMMLQSQKEEAENIANIRKLGLRIKNTNVEEKSLDGAINSLYISMHALQEISNILNEITEFWKRMSNLCKNLADPTLQSNLKEIGELPDEAYFQILEGLKLTIIQTYAGWKAIEIISHKYAEEAGKVRIKVLKHFQENLTTEQSRVKAKEMSDSLIDDCNSDLGENSRKQLAIQAEQAAITQ